jgi:hypothetical protein
MQKFSLTHFGVNVVRESIYAAVNVKNFGIEISEHNLLFKGNELKFPIKEHARNYHCRWCSFIGMSLVYPLPSVAVEPSHRNIMCNGG